MCSTIQRHFSIIVILAHQLLQYHTSARESIKSFYITSNNNSIKLHDLGGQVAPQFFEVTQPLHFSFSRLVFL